MDNCFAIIPLDLEYKHIGEDLLSKITEKIPNSVVSLECNFEKSFKIRMKKMRTNGYYNIIRIESDDNTIDVSMNDDSFETMNISDYLDLIESYEPDNEQDNDSDNESNKQEDQDNTCNIS
jgi:hypothetical protein